MDDTDSQQVSSPPLATPLLLVLISVTHLAYAPLTALFAAPKLSLPFLASLLLGGGYALSAWLARRGRGFATAVNLIVGEDLGALAAGILLGYPWAEYARPGTVIIVAFQFCLAIAEIMKRQDSGRPITPATRLAWFVVLYAVAFAAYAILRPHGLWRRLPVT